MFGFSHKYLWSAGKVVIKICDLVEIFKPVFVSQSNCLKLPEKTTQFNIEDKPKLYREGF